MLDAKFFSWLQDTPFYRGVHAQAVEAVEPGAGRSWVDVGCGPGLVGLLAAARGYQVQGYDASAAMVAHAQARAEAEGLEAHFSVGRLGALPERQAEVVSAASLVCVLADPRQGLELLWRHVAPGGSLLVVETTAAMTLEAAWRRTPRPLPALLWALARRGRTVAGAIDAWRPADEAQRTVLLLADGTVAAWRITRSTTSHPRSTP